jgi:hypothetical protein
MVGLLIASTLLLMSIHDFHRGAGFQNPGLAPWGWFEPREVIRGVEVKRDRIGAGVRLQRRPEMSRPALASG